MSVFATIYRRLYVALAELRWSALIAVALGHALLCALAFRLLGEAQLIGDWRDFVYHYITTATTVGYGDLSPEKSGGRLFAALVELPGGIALFTAVLGKAAAGIGGFWRRRLNGLGDFSERAGHSVVIGWQEGQTRRLLDLLCAELGAGEPHAVLVDKSLPANPMPDAVDYVRAERLADPAALRRAGVPRARAVIVIGSDDDETLAATLAVATTATAAHVVANFQDAAAGALIRQIHPGIETVGPLSCEILVRAARDPGSSAIASLLFSAGACDAAFSLAVPARTAPLSYADAFLGLKKLHGVTLVGMARGGKVDLNCEDAATVAPGQVLYYIADRRLDPAGLAWNRFAEVAR